MNFEIIPINDQDGLRTVNARELHSFLAVGKVFAAWIRERIDQYGFEENRDFFPVSEKSSGGRPRIEYHLTMDMAKELSMVERNHHGKLARQYFIACEKALVQAQMDRLRGPVQITSGQVPGEFLEEVSFSRTLARMDNPMERALALGRLIEDGKTVRELTQELHCHQSSIYSHLTLLVLDSEARDAVRSRQLSQKAGAALARIKDPEKQKRALKTIQTKKLSEKESISLIRGSL
jgi:phage anti-repressor protein